MLKLHYFLLNLTYTNGLVIIIQLIKDWVLFVIVVIVVAVDLTIMTVGTAVPSSRLNATYIRDTQHPNSVTVSSKSVISENIL